MIHVFRGRAINWLGRFSIDIFRGSRNSIKELYVEFFIDARNDTFIRPVRLPYRILSVRADNCERQIVGIEEAAERDYSSIIVPAKKYKDTPRFIFAFRPGKGEVEHIGTRQSAGGQSGRSLFAAQRTQAADKLEGR